MGEQPETTDDAVVALSTEDGAPAGMNIYFYYGWAAHANQTPYVSNATPDWCKGWREREQMIRRAVQEEIANG